MPHALPRRDFLAVSAAIALGSRVTNPFSWARPVPTSAQLAWQRDELALFTHFGINTFSNREWGDGTEDPAIFNPTALDARQWTRAAKAGGFKTVILTAKHHDGFCLWPTRTTKHSVAASPFRGGNGDVVREVADACKADDLKLGLYLSPWDRNAGVYGTDKYSDFYCEQLTELLTNYGPVHEVWFDGANGEGPSGKKQIYDWPRYWNLVKMLQPNSVIFSDAGPDIRWIGTENGVAGETNWSTVVPEVVPFPGMSSAAGTKMMQQGDPNGSVWRPGETDVSIRPGWFWHPAEDARVRSVDNLVKLYDTSVGRNSKLLLNVPPTTAGLLHETDVANLAGMRTALDARFAKTIVDYGADGGVVDLTGMHEYHYFDFSSRAPKHGISLLVLEEPIEQGQFVSGWRIEGHSSSGSVLLASGTTIGNKRVASLDNQVKFTDLSLTFDMVAPNKNSGIRWTLY